MTTDLLVDTCVLIDALRAYPPAVKFLESLDLVCVSAVTAAELIEGCQNLGEQKKIEKLLSDYLVIDLSENISQRALGLIKKFHRRFGILFDDALIAATALEVKMTLATVDKKHFDSINGLKIQVPY